MTAISTRIVWIFRSKLKTRSPGGADDGIPADEDARLRDPSSVGAGGRVINKRRIQKSGDGKMVSSVGA
jgi:hypothetical protein